MLRSLTTAISGLRSNQTMMDVVANNLANVNTIGYKAQRTTFKDLLFQTERGASASSANGLGGTNPQQVGLGSAVGSIDNLITQGGLQGTGNPLDLAIQGEGYFRVTADPVGFTGVQYTRAGNFSLDDQGRLVTTEGYLVIGYEVDPVTGGPTATETVITIPAGAKSINIAQNGLVTVLDATNNVQQIAYISLARFANPAGLNRVSGNRWEASLASGAEVAGTPGDANGFGTIASGALELSNVDLSQEFANMIVAQRAIQANARVITADDEILLALIQIKR